MIMRVVYFKRTKNSLYETGIRIEPSDIVLDSNGHKMKEIWDTKLGTTVLDLTDIMLSDYSSDQMLISNYKEITDRITLSIPSTLRLALIAEILKYDPDLENYIALSIHLKAFTYASLEIDVCMLLEIESELVQCEGEKLNKLRVLINKALVDNNIPTD